MIQPSFSVCIPNFNYEKYIGETIGSVLGQTYPHFEIIVTDNASTDRSWEIICAYAKKDARVHVFRNNINVGFASNLQKASEKATGDVIILLSADDLMYPDALETYARLYQEAGYEGNHTIMHSAFYVIDSQSEKQYACYRFPKDKTVYTPADFFQLETTDDTLPEFDGSHVRQEGSLVLKNSLFDETTPAAFCTTAYPRVLYQKLEGYDQSYQYMPDYAFLMKMLSFNPKVVYVRKNLFGYRIHNNNQQAIQNKMGALKKLHDDYLFTYSYPDEMLKSCGVSRAEIISYFVNTKCMSNANSFFKFGSWLQGFRYIMFAIACYPNIAFSSTKTYASFCWMLIGPFFKLAYKLLRSGKKQK